MFKQESGLGRFLLLVIQRFHGLSEKLPIRGSLYWAVNILGLMLFTALFVFASGRVLRRNLMKGL